MFSLVSGLSSTSSAGSRPPLFGRFAGTTPLYDSPVAVRVELIAHRFAPPARSVPASGSDWVSRFSRVELLYMRGFFDSAGTRRTCDIARRPVAFRLG
jgi:hypothetical protein